MAVSCIKTAIHFFVYILKIIKEEIIMSRKKYLLGVNNYDKLVFGEFEVTERNGYPEFSASFSTVFPITEDDVDAEEYYKSLVEEVDAEEYYENLVEEMDDSWVLEQLKFYRDYSLYPEKIDVNGTTYYFESSACGQHDTREEGMKLFTNQNAYDKLHELWDLYHLKKVDEEVIKEVQEIQEALNEIDEVEWITNWIKERGY